MSGNLSFTNCLSKDRDVLLAFFDFPAEHWVHLQTTNPIESLFATACLRTCKTKGCGSRIATLTRGVIDHGDNVGQLPNPETQARMLVMADRLELRANFLQQASENENDYEALLDIKKEMNKAGMPQNDLDRMEEMVDAALAVWCEEDEGEDDEPEENTPSENAELDGDAPVTSNLDKLKVAARWVAVLPGAVLAAVLMGMLIRLVLFEGGERVFWFIPTDAIVYRVIADLVHSGVFGGFLIASAAYIAPSHKNWASTVVLGLFLMFCGDLTLLIIMAGEWLSLVFPATSLLVAGITTFGVWEDEGSFY